MTRTLLALPALLLALAACEPVVVLPTEPDGGIGDSCGASALQPLLGQPASALDGLRLSQPFRIIRPGDMVTMDYLAQRVNFRLGPDGRIVEITCG